MAKIPITSSLDTHYIISRHIENFLHGSEVKKFFEINERLSKKWPVISQAKDAPSDAKEWENKKNKLELLEE